MLRPYEEHFLMRLLAVTLIRFFHHSIAALLITLAGNCGIVQAQQKTAPAQEKPKIRAITAFINPEWLVEVEADCVSQDYS